MIPDTPAINNLIYLVGGFNHLEKYESKGSIIPYIMENKKMKPPDRCYTPAIYHSIYRCCCHCLFHVFSLTVGHSRAYHVKLPNIGGSSHRSVKQSPAFFAVSPWNSIPLWSGFRGFLLTATASPIEVAKLTTHYLTLPRHVRWKRMEKDGLSVL